MVSESTNDFAYCRAIINHQLRYAESCEVQAEYDYPHGAPIALFTMLWIEGYINYLIAVLFPHNFESDDTRKDFRQKYRGIEKKFKYLRKNLDLSLTWPNEFATLLKFRNRICHAMVVNTELPKETDFSIGSSFVDSFEHAMGTITQVKARHAFTETFLTQLHDSIKNMSLENRQALTFRVRDKTTEYRLASLQRIKHPVHSWLTIESQLNTSKVK